MIDSTSFPLAEQPRLRPIEIIPVEDRGRRAFVLCDPADPKISPISLSDGAAEILVLLDGQRTVRELSTLLLLRGASITETQLRTFLTRLDEAGFLDGPRAEHRAGQRMAKFQALDVRPAIHAGGAYPSDVNELASTLAAGYLDADGPGSLSSTRPARSAAPRAVIAPHVDLHRGAPTYSWAYKALAEAKPAELYVILGTCHAPVRGHFAATHKSYDTPLGAVPTDIEFLKRLGHLTGRNLFEGEFSHLGEHSIEFQAVYLRSLGLAGSQNNGASVIPILCDSLHSMVPFGKMPTDVPVVTEFLAALRAAMTEDGRQITLIAAVDLAHVGPRFGDDWLVDTARQRGVERRDREMLDVVLAPDAAAYYAQVMQDHDARRICGLTPIYLLTALMQAEHRPGELLRYTQWVDTDLTSSVTFASAIFR
jgi:AmmeMemoRadiSam system protein B